MIIKVRNYAIFVLSKKFWQCLSWLTTLVAALLMARPVLSAQFTSGSTGADGAFSPTANTTLNVPPSGIFNFTTITIPVGVTVTFVPNTTNTPVTMLASGDITIAGIINVSGADGSTGNSMSIPSGGAGGPGGFAGGAGGLAPPWNGGTALPYGLGLGPGAGGNTCNGWPAVFATPGSPSQGYCNGTFYGTSTLLPLIGGSGGNGGVDAGGSSLTCPNGCNGGGGGGGGGAILIASSGTFTLNGSILANGGAGGTGFQPGGPGSGGGIRIIANTITGNGNISAMGGVTSPSVIGGGGRVRIEANSLSFSGTISPSATVSAPGIVNFPVVPTLSITAIGGMAVPSSASGSFISPDITLPSSVANPVTVNLTASNIPIGTVIKVIGVGRDMYSNQIANSTPLSGSNSSSTASASIYIYPAMVNVLRAEATFPVQTASLDLPIFVEGERVKLARVASALGGPSEMFLITESGKEVRWR